MGDKRMSSMNLGHPAAAMGERRMSSMNLGPAAALGERRMSSVNLGHAALGERRMSSMSMGGPRPGAVLGDRRKSSMSMGGGAMSGPSSKRFVRNVADIPQNDDEVLGIAPPPLSWIRLQLVFDLVVAARSAHSGTHNIEDAEGEALMATLMKKKLKRIDTPPWIRWRPSDFQRPELPAMVPDCRPYLPDARHQRSQPTFNSRPGGPKQTAILKQRGNNITVKSRFGTNLAAVSRHQMIPKLCKTRVAPADSEEATMPRSVPGRALPSLTGRRTGATPLTTGPRSDRPVTTQTLRPERPEYL